MATTAMTGPGQRQESRNASHSPLQVWQGSLAPGSFLAAFSDVLAARTQTGVPT